MSTLFSTYSPILGGKVSTFKIDTYFPNIFCNLYNVFFYTEFPEGKLIDCDLCLPTFASSTRYDGRINDVGKYLEAERPKGWIQETAKLQDMRAQAGDPRLFEQKEFQLRFRQISPGVILPQQAR